MPDGLEYVVRPYQARGQFGQVVIPATPAASRERATLTWGAQSTMPARQDGVGFQVVCCNEDLDEQSRESDTVRITDPTNSANYVDVARPRTVKLKKQGKNNCGDDWDQISGVAQAVDSSLAEFAGDIHSGTAAIGGDPAQCNVGWKFQNQQSSG
jgi:hypothetical protein